MDKLISGQAAIDAIYDAFCYAYCDNCENEMNNEDLCADCHRKYQNWSASKKIIERVINNLPSAQPERKKGKWEIYVISMLDGEGCKCSECGSEGAPYYDFCPGCGADMRGEADDKTESD